jgi:hypothetical protein
VAGRVAVGEREGALGRFSCEGRHEGRCCRVARVTKKQTRKDDVGGSSLASASSSRGAFNY